MPEPKRPDAAQPASTNPIDLSISYSMNAKEPADATNTMLGEFRLLKKLGTGGMAEVYLAEQTTLRRQVAVKILRAEYFTDEQYVKRFRHEAAAAGSLNHPNIVQVYMVGEENGINYIAQEYVQGRTLKDYMNRKGPMEVKIALHILRQVASALQVASENGIVHRDIKSCRLRISATDTSRRTNIAHPIRIDVGNTFVHESRTGERSAAGCAERHLLVRTHGLADARGSATVHGRDRDVGRRETSERQATRNHRVSVGPARVAARLDQATDQQTERRSTCRLRRRGE